MDDFSFGLDMCLWFSDFLGSVVVPSCDQILQSEQIQGGKLRNLFFSKLSLWGDFGTCGSIVNLNLSVEWVDQFFGPTRPTKLVVDHVHLTNPRSVFYGQVQPNTLELDGLVQHQTYL
jgi:hypothetical protein